MSKVYMVRRTTAQAQIVNTRSRCYTVRPFLNKQPPSKTAQVERLCPWEWLKGEPFSTYIKPKYKTAIGIHPWSKSSVRNSNWLPQFPLEVSAGCCKCRIGWCYLSAAICSFTWEPHWREHSALPRCPSIRNSSWLPQLVFPVISGQCL